MKLAIVLENFKGVFARNCVVSDDLSFTSVEIDRNYSLTLPQWKCLCQGLSSNDQGRQRRESLGTRLNKIETESNDARYGSSFETFAINNGVWICSSRSLINGPLLGGYPGSWSTFCSRCRCGEVAIVERLTQV